VSAADLLEYYVVSASIGAPDVERLDPIPDGNKVIADL
jgi:hypothetical protein